MSRRGWVGAVAVFAALVGTVALPHRVGAAAPPPQVPHLAGAPTCGASPADPNQPTSAGRTQPDPAVDYFAPDVPRFTETVWGGPVGGFGGLRRGVALHHTPVVFVHGNQADAQNWLTVMQQFQDDAGYTMQEMWALSYNGLGNFYGGAPVQHQPSTLDRLYVQQNPNGLANGGHGSADDDEVPQLCRFIELVQWYTGSPEVDIVAHSLGVTITRRTLELYPALAAHVAAVVDIAGANHGTTVCRGLETSYYGCNEIAPGTAWLTALNGPSGSLEAPGPARWMSVYDGTGVDPFYADPSDHDSPRQQGADNRTFPGTYHNDLRVGAAEVDTYLPFLLRYGQSGPGAAAGGATLAATIEAAQPDTSQGPELCGVEALTGTVPGCPAIPTSGSGGTTSAGGGGSAAGGTTATGSGALVNTAGTASRAGLATAAVAGLLLTAGSRLRRRRRR